MIRKTAVIFVAFAVAGLGLVLLPGCLNVFGPIDNPHNDYEYISAARAAFDQGDFETAAKYYAKVSAAAQDTATSETVFSTLYQQGAGMNTFMKALGKQGTNAGALLTTIAGYLTSGAGQTKRLAIYNAYLQAKTISPSNPGTRGFTRFMAAIAFTAEIFAEDASTPGVYYQTDLVVLPSGCTVSNCAASPNCNSAGTNLTILGIVGTQGLDDALVTQATVSGAIDLDMIHYGLISANAALQEMSAGGGGVAGSTTQLVTALTALTAQPGCYRQALLSANIGQ